MRDGRPLPDPIEDAAGYARHEVRIFALANRGDLQKPGQPRLHAQRRKAFVNLVHRQVLEGDRGLKHRPTAPATAVLRTCSASICCRLANCLLLAEPSIARTAISWIWA